MYKVFQSCALLLALSAFCLANQEVQALKDLEIRSSWSNVTIDEACDPNHESNWWNIKVNTSISAAFDFVCLYTDEVLGQDNFTAFKEELVPYRSLLDQVEGNEEITRYLNQLTDEELQLFVDEYAKFWEVYGNIICTNSKGFLKAIDFIIVGLTDPDILELMTEVLEQYVAYVERNQPVILEQANADLWGLDRVDQPNLPFDNAFNPAGTGANVHAYVIDTGINAGHEEFTGRVQNGYDFVDNDDDPNDCNGHGTHCAGTVLGTNYGVAKNAILHGVKVLSCSGSGSWSGVLGGMNWVAVNHIKPAVASMSLGGGFSQSINDGVNALYDAGVPVAVAAGNENSDACGTSPASATKAYTVSSSTISDARSGFSNFGSCCKIFAPGSSIKSAWFQSPTQTNTISGTSMATPHVAGGMAVYLGLNPSATPAQVYDAITATAVTGKITDIQGTPNRLLQVSTFPGGCDLSLPENSNCVMSDWSAWGECSTANSCGFGTKTATRTVVTPETGCGSCLDGNQLTKEEECIVNACPQTQPTQEVANAADFAFTSFALGPNGASAYALLCSSSISQFPHDTADHTALALGDDAAISVSLNTPFTFFGTSYDTVYVGSNGFLTFGQLDTTWSATVTNHYAKKRISVFFSDLSPNNGGAVSYKELSDRFVVTWEAVPFYPSVFSVNMQVELLSSGNIIFNYGHMTSKSSGGMMIGVSSGNGKPSDYTSALLNASPNSCQADPPVTNSPTGSPTISPSVSPTGSPTQSPTDSPTDSPTSSPTGSPTDSPTSSPTISPTTSPTLSPSVSPTIPVSTTSPTASPEDPTANPTASPTLSPTDSPTISPTEFPTSSPTDIPTLSPTVVPTSFAPSSLPDPPSNEDLPAFLASPSQVFLDGVDSFSSSFSSSMLVSDAAKGDTGAAAATNGFSLSGKKMTFYPTARADKSFTSWDYRVTCVEETGMQDTADWTSLSLSDDSSRQITVSEAVLFGGESYFSLYVGSNGYVTFDSGDSTYQATSSVHFTKKRIAGTFMDLNPSSGGSVKWKDLTSTDGYVGVSFESIRSYSGLGTYNFQIAVYVDGRISITWGAYTETSAATIVGISTGKYPNGWQSVNLVSQENTYIDCAVPPVFETEIPLEQRAPTQMFSSNFDLEGKSVTFSKVTTGELAYEVACTEDIQSFPRNSEGSWTSLSLNDDGSVKVLFADGQTFAFYGNLYDAAYIGSNGYITFGRQHTAWKATKYNHFVYPKVSALFMDLSPNRGGTVQYKQLADAFIVQFVDVPKYNSAATFSFQIELNFNGHISVSYMKYTVNDATTIVGLSAGALYGSVGVEEFIMLDLSNHPTTCPSSFNSASAMSSKNAVEYDSVVSQLSVNDNGVTDSLNICPSIQESGFYFSLNLKDAPPPPIVESPAQSPPQAAPTSGVGIRESLSACAMLFIMVMWLGIV